MCTCLSCKFTDEQGRKGFEREIDDVKRAKYIRARESGKIPADSAYTAHMRAAKFVPDLEFTAAELRDRSMRTYSAPAPRPGYFGIPHSWVTQFDRYIKEFDGANKLKPCRYEFIAPALNEMALAA